MAASIRSTARSSASRAGRTRRVLPAEVRIDALMNAAAALFIARGVETTTVDDITAAAGVGKGTFYHYFATKTDAVLALRERFTRRFLDQVGAAVEACPPGDHHARFEAWLSGAVGAYLGNFELHDVVFHDFRHDRRRSDEKDAVIDQLAGILSDGMQAGAWSLPDARAAAIVLFDGMHGVVDDAIAAGRRDPAPLCRLLRQLFGRILKG
ncbi:MAG: TetR/AcrR family transcriptional regulator [Rhizobiales bacterium]|nr:TetR/AcrR family transcriptional regulator [Hyphomicrobiales bacterium]